ncbi:MAG: hypothetical protein AAFU77_15295 [Myxococcota bacterium]
MDELEKRLREDADAIDGTVSPELARRIAGALELVGTPHRIEPRKSESPWLLWVVALASAAAAVAIVELRGATSEAPDLLRPPSAVTALTNSQAVLDPKQATNALLGPLTGELDALRADFETVKERLRGL